MTRKTLILLTGAAAALTACHRDWRHHDHDADTGPMQAVSQLHCPDSEGSLTRVRVAPDGLSCDYAGPRGAEVTLKLVRPANGDATAALDDLDAQMNALMPEVQGKVNAGAAQLKAEASDSDASSSSGSRKNVDINFPGFHIHTRGERAEIRMPGISIDADDDKGHGGSSHEGAAHVSVAGGLVDVRAHDDAAVVRIRGRGSAVRAGYRLADKAGSADGWRMVGYDAHGPSEGPLVVAVVKSKEDSEDPLFHDAQRLVKANTGS